MVPRRLPWRDRARSAIRFAQETRHRRRAGIAGEFRGDIHETAHRGDLARSSVETITQLRIGAVTQQHAHDLAQPVQGGQVQRPETTLVLHLQRRAFFQQAFEAGHQHCFIAGGAGFGTGAEQQQQRGQAGDGDLVGFGTGQIQGVEQGEQARAVMGGEAEQRGMPIYVLRANTVAQVEQFLGDLYNLSAAPLHDNMEDIRSETQRAIAAVLNGERWVDLPPGPSLVRRLQHEMARQAELVSHSYGKEPRRHVRIFRE